MPTGQIAYAPEWYLWDSPMPMSEFIIWQSVVRAMMEATHE